MKKWLISILAAGVALLASTAFADGSITLSPDGSTSTDASVRIDGQTVTITQAGTYQIAGTLDDGALIVEVYPRDYGGYAELKRSCDYLDELIDRIE